LYIFDEIFICRIYDQALSSRPEAIIDIGANTGLFVLRAKQLCPAAQIIAYEPEPANYAALRETIQLNQLLGVVTIKAAVAPRDGTLDLYLHPRNIGAHSTVFHRSSRSVSVPAIALSKVLRDRCDLLKIDAEGGELPIIEALTDETGSRIARIVYETGSEEAPRLAALLSGLGFKIDHISAPPTHDEPTVLAVKINEVSAPALQASY
jgi:FkbM family methyltransferase